MVLQRHRADALAGGTEERVQHRGRGHARSITLAAAAALRELGASSAQVCTESERVGAVAAYRSAGFAALPERFDRVRDA